MWIKAITKKTKRNFEGVVDKIGGHSRQTAQYKKTHGQPFYAFFFH